MKSRDFNRAIREIQAMRMTPSERNVLQTRIIRSNTFGRVESPWNVFSFGSWINTHKTGAVAIAALALVIFGGGGAAFASEKALPGDALYSFKIEIVEPFRGTLRSTAGENASWKAELITRRLGEAEALAAQGKLNRMNQEKLEALLDKHTEEYVVALNDVEIKESPERAQGIGTTLRASLVAHAKFFNELTIIASSDSFSSDPTETADHSAGPENDSSNSIAVRSMKVATDTEATSPESSELISPKVKSSENHEAAIHFGNKTAEHIENMSGSWKSAPVIQNLDNATSSENNTPSDENDLINSIEKSLNRDDGASNRSQTAAVNTAVDEDLKPLNSNSNKGGKKNQ